MTFKERLSGLIGKANEKKRLITDLRSSSDYYKDEIAKSINKKLEDLGDSDDSVRRILIEVPDLVANIVDNIKIAAIRSHESCETLDTIFEEYKKHEELESQNIDKDLDMGKKKVEKKKVKKSDRETVDGSMIRKIGKKPEDKIKTRKESHKTVS